MKSTIVVAIIAIILMTAVGVGIWQFQFAKEKEISRAKYSTGVIYLGLAFTAKAFCSCLFVVENSPSDCQEFASLEQVSPRLTADHKKKEVTASFFYLFSKKAKFLSQELGCLAL